MKWMVGVGLGEAVGDECSMRTQFSVWEDGNVLEIKGSDSCMTM